MKKSVLYTFLIILVSGFICSCQTQQREAEEVKEAEQKPVKISAENTLGQNPYLTSDHKGNPVLSWVEGEKENTTFYYAVSKDGGKTFGEKVLVKPGKGLSPHQESMPKVAFKKDGTVIAVFGNRRRVNRPGAMFEGEVYFSQSIDGGNTWSEPEFLHTDTAAGYSRSFFDIATLPDGEVGAIWIDGRNKLDKGSSIYFAKTEGKAGFGKDKLIAKGTCECCRTELLAGPDGNLHVAFRHIFSGTVRDMAYMQSSDGGNSFTEPTRISPDNWVLDGCPHTGPSLAMTTDGLQVVWFTDGGEKGVYYTRKQKGATNFENRMLLSDAARHPQIAASANGTLGITWDESQQQDSVFFHTIKLQRRKPGTEAITTTISDEKSKASHPVILALEDGFLVAWVATEGDSPAVYYKKI